MRVLVRRPDGSYYITVAFAIIYHRKPIDTELCIFNDQYDLEIVSKYFKTRSIEPQVLMMDYKHDDDWVKNGNLFGNPHFVNDPGIIKRIKKGEKEVFDYDTMILWKSYLNAELNENQKIYYVEDKDDATLLLEFTGYFHDGFVSKYEYDEKLKNLLLEIKYLWGIETLYLEFKNVINYNIEEDYLYDYFLEASLLVENGKVAFCNDEANKIDEISEGWTFVIAKELKWHFEIEEVKEFKSKETV